MLRELLDHTFEIGIAGAKAPCEPVPTALGNLLAVRDHLELAGLTRRKDGFNAEALFDEGHETRDLDLVVLSSRTVNDLDLHLVLQSDLGTLQFYQTGLKSLLRNSLSCEGAPSKLFAWAGFFVGVLRFPS